VTAPLAGDKAEAPATVAVPESPEPSDVPPEPVAVPGPEAISRTTAPESVKREISASPASVVRHIAASAAVQVPEAGHVLNVDPESDSGHGIDLPAAQESVGETASAAQRGLAELTERVRQEPVSTVAMEIDKLASLADRPSADFLGALVPVGNEPTTPTSLSMPDGETSLKEMATTPDLQRAGSFSLPEETAPNPFANTLSVESHTIESNVGQVAKPSRGMHALLSGAVARELDPIAGTGGDGNGDPAPSDIPLPTPESPANAIPDSVGPSFVPIAALLALLALAAPAARRRLGRALDLHVPTPFVCALERPG
jgi:hypothetical protein